MATDVQYVVYLMQPNYCSSSFHSVDTMLWNMLFWQSIRLHWTMRCVRRANVISLWICYYQSV